MTMGTTTMGPRFASWSRSPILHGGAGYGPPTGWRALGFAGVCQLPPWQQTKNFAAGGCLRGNSLSAPQLEFGTLNGTGQGDPYRPSQRHDASFTRSRDVPTTDRLVDSKGKCQRLAGRKSREVRQGERTMNRMP